jgi:hypothetical protein
MMMDTLLSRLALIAAYSSSLTLLSVFWAQEAKRFSLPIVSAVCFLVLYLIASWFSKKASLPRSRYWQNWFFAIIGGFYMTAIFCFLALSISLIGTSIVGPYFISLLSIVIGIFRIKFGTSEILANDANP